MSFGEVRIRLCFGNVFSGELKNIRPDNVELSKAKVRFYQPAGIQFNKNSLYKRKSG